MMRSLVVVLGAILLSGVLVAIVGFVVASGADTHLMLAVAADHEAGKAAGAERAEAVWEALERGHFRHTWVYNPAIALVVGAFVGLASGKRAWQLALAGTAPFAVMFSVGTRGIVSGVPFLCLYLAIGAASAWSTRLLMRRVRASQPRERAAQQ